MSGHLTVSPLAAGGLEVRVKAFILDNALYASSQGNVLLKFSEQNVRDAVFDFLQDGTAKQQKGIYPFAEAYKMRTLSGTFVLDATLTEEFAPELVAYLIEQDLPAELLERYKPE